MVEILAIAAIFSIGFITGFAFAFTVMVVQ